MQYERNKTTQMASDFCDMIMERFGNRVDDFSIVDVIDEPNWRSFGVEFFAYDYFVMRLNYDRGMFGCCICEGKFGIGLNSSQQNWNTADFDIFFDDLERELELRIPDKFLEAKGWKKKPEGFFERIKTRLQNWKSAKKDKVRES
mgnify:FL=1